MRASVFCGVSLDGFIARPDGSVDFLDGHGDVEGDLGFSAFLDSVDCMVMGRNTYDFVVASGAEWHYGDTPVFVLTTRSLGGPSPEGATVEPLQLGPEETMERLGATGFTHAYVDGGVVVQQFLAAGLIDELILTRVPVLIGEGIPLTAPDAGDVPLEHGGTDVFGNGFVQSRYTVRR